MEGEFCLSYFIYLFLFVKFVSVKLLGVNPKRLSRNGKIAL